MAKEIKKKPIDESHIANQIAYMAQKAVGISATNIANKQEIALERYLRKPFEKDDEIVGRSKFVGAEVTTQVDWSSADVLRVFDTQREPVKFQPNTSSATDIAIARQLTTVINNLLRQRNKHTTFLLQWLKNGFMTGIGITTVCFEAYDDETLPQLVKGLTDEALVQVYDDEQAGDITVLEVGQPYDAPMPALPPGVPPEYAEIAKTMLPKVRDIKIRRKKRVIDLSIKNLPVEDFIVSKDAQICEKTGGIAARLQGHKRLMSRDDLIDMGFDEAKVKKISLASEKNAGIAAERNIETDGEDGTNDVTEEVTVYEIYTKMKLDGIRSRHYRFTLAGELGNGAVLLDHQEVSKYYPYAPFVPYPIPNTLFGQSMVDRIGQEHRFISVSKRSVFDNLAAHSNPIKVVNPEVTNVDDVLNLYPGAVVRSTSPDAGITYNQQQFTGANAMSMIDAVRAELDFNTGVGPTVTGLEVGDFAETATGASQRKNAGMLFIEQICRWFAETGYSYLVKLIVDALVSNPEDAQTYIQRLTDNFVPITIDDWDPDMDVSANVAFGVMNKDFNAGMLREIYGHQMQAQAMGLAGPQQIYNTLSKFVENASFTNVGDFYLDPSKQPPKPPAPQQPDPLMIQAQIAQEQLALEKTKADQKFRLEVAKLEDQSDRERDQMAQELYIAKAEVQGKYGAQIETARIKAAQDAQRNDIDMALARQDAQNQAMGHLAAMQQPQQPPMPPQE